MIVLHTADWHLGQELYGYDRTEEHGEFLEWLVALVEDRRVDALVVAGDVYHTTNPSVRAQQALFSVISRLKLRRPTLDIVLAGGNHDSPARLELPRALLDESQVTIVGALPRHDGAPDFDALLAPLTDEDGLLRAVCVTVPFLRPGDVSTRAEHEADALQALLKEAVARAKARFPGAAVVLTGHLSVSGADISRLSERRIVIGGAETVSTDVFPEAADYVALGHLHRPQTLSGPTLIRYAGAPLPMSATERDYRHSVTLLHIDAAEAGARIELEFVETPRPVPFLRTPAQGSAPLDEIVALLAALDIEERPPALQPFLEIAVKLDAPVPDLRARIDAALGAAPVRLSRILRDHGETESASPAAAPDLRALTPEQTFSRLYRETYSEAAPDRLLDAFRDLVAEVEIGDVGADAVADTVSAEDKMRETRA